MGFLDKHLPLVEMIPKRAEELETFAAILEKVEANIAKKRAREARMLPDQSWRTNLPLYVKEARDVVIPQRGGDPDENDLGED